MHLFVCLAGLPIEAIAEISKRPTRFTGNRGTAPIANRMSSSFTYQPGMEDYYHQKLSEGISQIAPNDDVGVVLAYVNYSGSERFVSRFFPFALVAPIEPFYYHAHPPHARREELNKFVDGAEAVVAHLRDRAAIMRDHFSGQNFSPLTLPIRNFRSGSLSQVLGALFRDLSESSDVRAAIKEGCDCVVQQHPLKKDPGHWLYFEDERGLRFKSPGRDRHGFNRGGNAAHHPVCHLNSRARLGGPLKANFHYDCDYEHRNLDEAYPNCHGALDSPSHHTHVNIAPNDAIR